MARRRYLSTDISVDPKVADLATDYGDFAALLYTWLIPHAGDDASVPVDARRILMAVVPGLGKTPKDVEHAVNGMVKLGLLAFSSAGGLHFPESFFKHQSYISEKRRGSPHPEPTPPPSGDDPTPRRDSAHNGAHQRSSPRNGASSSFKSSSSLKVSSSVKSSPPAPSERPPSGLRLVGEPVPKPKKTPNAVTTFLEAVKGLDGDLDVYGDKAFLGTRLKANPDLDLDLMAEAYVAYRHGEWPGSKKLQEAGDPVWVIGDLGAYVRWKADRIAADTSPESEPEWGPAATATESPRPMPEWTPPEPTRDTLECPDCGLVVDDRALHGEGCQYRGAWPARIRHLLSKQPSGVAA